MNPREVQNGDIVNNVEIICVTLRVEGIFFCILLKKVSIFQSFFLKFAFELKILGEFKKNTCKTTKQNIKN